MWNVRGILQFLFAAHSVFLQLDKDAGFPPPDQVDELSILCAKDDPEIRREIRLKDASAVSVVEVGGALTWTGSPQT